MRTLVRERVGGTDEMNIVECRRPTVGTGEVLVSVAAAGMNAIDLGVLSGAPWNDWVYLSRPGTEGSGRITCIGRGVKNCVVGQRVAWAFAPGSYASEIVVPASVLVPVPDAIDDRTAASIMMDGLFASHLAADVYPVGPGDIALVRSASRGIGHLLAQIVKLRGARVVAGVSSVQDFVTAQRTRADRVVIGTRRRAAEVAARGCEGRGVSIAYEDGDAASLEESVDVLQPSGTLCWYGVTLGKASLSDETKVPKDIRLVAPALFDHIRTPALIRQRAAQLFQWVTEQKLVPSRIREYRLNEAHSAYMDMRARDLTDKILLIP